MLHLLATCLTHPASVLAGFSLPGFGLVGGGGDPRSGCAGGRLVLSSDGRGVGLTQRNTGDKCNSEE